MKRMSRSEKQIVSIMAVFCAVFLIMDVFPGVMTNVALLVIFFGCPLILLALGIVIVLAQRTILALAHDRPPPMSFVAMGLIFAMPVVSLCFSVVGCSPRAGFLLSKGAFEDYIESGGPNVTRKLRFGIYEVDEIQSFSDADGVYFRTNTSPDLIDTISHGFAYKPDRSTTPFGSADYSLTWLWGDWYLFSVSDDY